MHTRGSPRKGRRFLERVHGGVLLFLSTDLWKGGGELAKAIQYTFLGAIYRMKQQQNEITRSRRIRTSPREPPIWLEFRLLDPPSPIAAPEPGSPSSIRLFASLCRAPLRSLHHDSHSVNHPPSLQDHLHATHLPHLSPPQLLCKAPTSSQLLPTDGSWYTGLLRERRK